MNDQASHDLRWPETISLLSAGCLPQEEERAARQHLESCAACQEQFRQLTALCAALEAARPAHLECGPDFAGRVMAAISTDQSGPRLLQVRRLRIHRGWAIASALAASLILALVLRSFWSPRWQEPKLAQKPQPRAVPPAVTPKANFRERPPAPTLFAYERSFSQSSDAIDSLLDEEARRLSFLSTNPRIAAMQELLQ